MVRVIQWFAVSTMLMAIGCGSPWHGDQCTASATCQPHEEWVAVCSNSTCNLVEMCGQEILCQTPPTVDYCEYYGWYGDGTCDEFCQQRDPDCEPINCAIWIGCHDYEVEVESCEGEACRETVHCDGSHAKWCDRSACLEAPVCEPGFVEREDACAEGESCYQEQACGREVACVELPTACDEPVCDDGSQPTTACPQDELCVELEVCDVLYYCPLHVQCPGVPSCADGYVEDGTSCPPADSMCYEETVCGQTIACRPGLGPCEAYPVCEEGHNEVPLCDVSDVTCVREEMCGHEIYCQAQCRAIPTCEDGYVEDTAPCDATDLDCYEESVCGTTITCRLSP